MLDTVLNLTAVAGACITLGVVVFFGMRQGVQRQTIANLKDNNDSLMGRVQLLEEEKKTRADEHTENVKQIEFLKGQIQTYKEIPLTEISASLKEFVVSQKQIAQAQHDILKLIGKGPREVDKARGSA